MKRLQRWARFVVAGLGGFIVQIGILAALTAWTSLHYIAATAIAVELAILVNFIWHELWTWSDRPSGDWRERWLRLSRFNALTGVTSVLGTTVLTALLVETTELSPIASNVVAVVACGLLNFAGSETLVFKMSAIVAIMGASSADASILQPRTARDFSRYAAAVETRTWRELRADGPFLSIDRRPAPEIDSNKAALRRGDVLVMKGSAADDSSHEIDVDGGSIHHWRGIILIPNVTLDHVLGKLKQPGHDTHKQEDVLSSRVLARHGDALRLFLRLKRTKIVTVVYDSEHDVRYWTVGPGRAASSSVSTRIVEVDNPGTPSERALPEGNDHGYLWRLNSYWRYQQVEGGVVVELESLTLSRDIPFVFKPLVRPLVDRVARESIERTLASLRARFHLRSSETR